MTNSNTQEFTTVDQQTMNMFWEASEMDMEEYFDIDINKQHLADMDLMDQFPSVGPMIVIVHPEQKKAITSKPLINKISEKFPSVNIIEREMINEQPLYLNEEKKSENKINNSDENSSQKCLIYTLSERKENRTMYKPNQQNTKELFSMLKLKMASNDIQSYADTQSEDVPSGIMIDIDYQQHSPHPQEMVGHIKLLCEEIAMYINRTFAIDDEKLINIFVCIRPLAIDGSKPGTTNKVLKHKKKSYKHGFHILIPELLLVKSEKQFMIANLMEELNFGRIFSGCAFVDYNLLDMACAHVPVYLPGSSAPGKLGYHEVKCRYQFEPSDCDAIALEPCSMREIKNIPLELSINKWGFEKVLNKERTTFKDSTAYDAWLEEKENGKKESEEKAMKYIPTQEYISRVVSTEQNIDRFFRILFMGVNNLSQKYRDITPLWKKVIAFLKSMQETYGVDKNRMLKLADKFSSQSSEYIDTEDVVKNYESANPYGQWLYMRYLLRGNATAQKKYCKFWNLSFPEKIDFHYIKNVASITKTPEGFQHVKKLIVDFMNAQLCIIKASKTYYLKTWMDYDEDNDKFVEKIQQKVLNDLKQDYVEFSVYVPLPLDVQKTAGLTPAKMHLSFLDVWQKSQRRNKFDKLTFSPKMYHEHIQPKNIKNLYEGPGHGRNDDIEIPENFERDEEFFKHIRDRWCNGNMERYNAVLDRFAHQIQKPWVKMGSALCLRGTNRIGKGLPIQIIADIVGANYMFQPTNSEQVFGVFNEGMAKCLMLFVDEMVWGGDKERAGTLKKLVTEKRLYINKKYMPLETLKNQANIYMASNEDWMVPAGKTEQRWQVLDVNDSLLHLPTEEKERVINAIVGIDRDMLANFFHRRDISKWNHNNIVITDGLRLQKIQSLCKLDAWWLDAINRGMIGRIDVEFGEWISKQEVMDAYINYSKDKHISDVKFWLMTKAMAVIKKETKGRGPNRPAMVLFGSLEQQKEAWRKYMNDPNWSLFDL